MAIKILKHQIGYIDNGQVKDIEEDVIYEEVVNTGSFNSHPYKTIKLTKKENGDFVTKEYYELKVDGNIIWRKPMDYDYKFYIVNPDNTIIKSYDALRDTDYESYVNIYHTVKGNFVKVLSVLENKNLSNKNIIKYNDGMYYNVALNPGYEIKANNSVMDNTSLLQGVIYPVLKDFTVDIRIGPILYDLQVLEDNGIASCVILRIPGKIATLQGIMPGNITTEDKLYYGDTLTFTFTPAEHYILNGNSTETIVVDNATLVDNKITITKTSTVVNFKVFIVKNTGVDNIVVKRVYRRLPYASSEEVVLSNNSSINYGDDISVEAISKNGYYMNPYTQLYENISNNILVSPTAEVITGVLSKSLGQGVSSIAVKNRQGVEILEGYNVDYGTALYITAVASTGYTLDNFVSPIIAHPVYEGAIINIEVTAHLTAYTLNITADNESINQYTMSRVSSPSGAPTGPINNGDTVYYNDVIRVAMTANTNYVVGPGYNTTYTRDYACTEFDSFGKYNKLISGTYTTPITIYQRTKSGNTQAGQMLDAGDRITLMINYPDNPNTPVAYDPTKRVRVDQFIKLYPSNQLFLPELPSIEGVRIFFNNPNYMDLDLLVDYYEIPAIVQEVEVYFVPEAIDVKLFISSDLVKYINPNITDVVVTIYSSKYKGTSTVSTNYSVADHDYYSSGQIHELNLQFYYKDVIKIRYADVTGWTFEEINLIPNSTHTPEEYSNNDPMTLIDISGYDIEILRNIDYYTITFENTYAKYTGIVINGVNQITEWDSPYGKTTKEYSVPYGSRFRKLANPSTDNYPMDVQLISHINNNDYYVNQDNILVSHNYYSRLIFPIITRVECTLTNSNNPYPKFNITWDCENNTSADPYNAVIGYTRILDGNTISDTLDIVPSYEGSNSAVEVGNYSLQKKSYSYTVTYIVEIYFQGKTVGNVSRTDSQVATYELTVTVPPYTS